MKSKLRILRIWWYGKYSLLKRIEICVRYARSEKRLKQMVNDGNIEIIAEMKFPKQKILN